MRPATERTTYFTCESIDRVAAGMLGAVSALRGRHPLVIEPNRAALLILDLQRYFADPVSHAFVPSLPAIVSRVEALARAFSAQGRPVFLTRHIDGPDPGNPMRGWWSGVIERGSPESELIDPMQTLDAPVLEKHAYDAFLGTDLEQRLLDAGVRQLAICGIHTHLCCDTTARSAFMRGFEVLFTIDGTATYNEALHQASLLTLSHGFAVPLLCREVSDALEMP